MLLTQGGLRRKHLIRNSKSPNSESHGYHGLQLSKELVEQVERGLATAIDCFPPLFFQKWMNLVTLRF